MALILLWLLAGLLTTLALYRFRRDPMGWGWCVALIVAGPLPALVLGVALVWLAMVGVWTERAEETHDQPRPAPLGMGPEWRP